MFGVSNDGVSNQTDFTVKKTDDNVQLKQTDKKVSEPKLTPMELLSNLTPQDSLLNLNFGLPSLNTPLIYPLFDNNVKVEEKNSPEQAADIEKLKKMTPKELKQLGQKDPKAFLKALIPAALESEKLYGVPAEVILAQAAIESGWGKSPIGFNIFGMKGVGPAGSITATTAEYVKGKRIVVKAKFANYHNFYEAVSQHGKLFVAGNAKYANAINQYAKDKSAANFVDNIAKTYATAPTYNKIIKSTINKYDISDMLNEAKTKYSK